MTRMTVAIEGSNVNNCVILPGALWCREDEVPVNWNGNDKQILGKASGFQREGQEITMEIELNEDIYLDLEDKIGAFVYVQPFEAKENAFIKGALAQVHRGRIRAVSLHDKKV